MTWKLLQAVHKELLCDNSPSTRIVEEVNPLQVGRRTGRCFCQIKGSIMQSSSPCLSKPRCTYIMDTDARNLAIGAVLSHVQDS